MKIYIDRHKVNSRATLANTASVGGMLLLPRCVRPLLSVQSHGPFTLVLLFVGGATSGFGI